MDASNVSMHEPAFEVTENVPRRRRRINLERDAVLARSIASGGTTEPVMMISPAAAARRRRPAHRRRGARCRSIARYWPADRWCARTRRRGDDAAGQTVGARRRAPGRRRPAPRGADRCSRRGSARGPPGGVCRSTSSIAGEMPAIAPRRCRGRRRPERRGRYGPRSRARPPASPSPRATRCARLNARILGQESHQRAADAERSASPARRSRPSSPAACRRPRGAWRRSSSCARMPRATRGSSQSFIAAPHGGPSSRTGDSPDRPRSRTPRSSRRPSSPTPAPRPRSRCC